MINSTLEVGKIYLIRHSRKGKFVIYIESIHGEWVNAEILEGTTTTFNPDNSRGAGEKITIRETLITDATEVNLR
jgi:hypothetical protein